LLSINGDNFEKMDDMQLELNRLKCANEKLEKDLEIERERARKGEGDLERWRKTMLEMVHP
jgi:hypothetical protein